jgi:hypothetical protein
MIIAPWLFLYGLGFERRCLCRPRGLFKAAAAVCQSISSDCDAAIASKTHPPIQRALTPASPVLMQWSATDLPGVVQFADALGRNLHSSILGD